MIIASPHAFMLNALSFGDVIAARGPLKFAIEHIVRGTEYKVLALPAFRDLLHFVPEENFGSSLVVHTFPKNWHIMSLNTKGHPPNVSRVTSMKMHLAQYASIKLLDCILPDKHLLYFPLPKADITRFNIDFTKAVLFVVTHRDETRRLPKEVVYETAGWVRDKGFTPVYVGRVDHDKVWADAPLQSSFEIPDFGIDLRDQTSFTELASICDVAAAIVGPDSGPIHLAGTTQIPIVCAYTNVAPETRVPLREKGQTLAVRADVECLHCQTNFWLPHHDFGLCYFKTYDCCKKLTPDMFIKALEHVLK